VAQAEVVVNMLAVVPGVPGIHQQLLQAKAVLEEQAMNLTIQPVEGVVLVQQGVQPGQMVEQEE